MSTATEPFLLTKAQLSPEDVAALVAALLGADTADAHPAEPRAAARWRPVAAYHNPADWRRS